MILNLAANHKYGDQRIIGITQSFKLYDANQKKENNFELKNNIQAFMYRQSDNTSG